MELPEQHGTGGGNDGEDYHPPTQAHSAARATRAARVKPQPARTQARGALNNIHTGHALTLADYYPTVTPRVLMSYRASQMTINYYRCPKSHQPVVSHLARLPFGSLVPAVLVSRRDSTRSRDSPQTGTSFSSPPSLEEPAVCALPSPLRQPWIQEQ